MSEWWTYRLSDFLMFSPRTYWRLVADYNAAFWPAQAVVLALALAVTWVASRGERRWAAAACVLFALAWANVGWSFILERYRDIFTGAVYMAAAAAVQAVAMLGAAFLAQAPRQRSISFWGVLVALVAYPEVTGAAEWFGFMPDPTALATPFFVWATQRTQAVRIGLSVIPLAMLAAGWATRVNLAGVG